MITGNKIALDGWTFDNNTWQGVRTYDASVGQWNTPDAYAGEVHDPMSQKPFMWNRNNPYAYDDPSGYSSEDQTERALEAELLGGEMTALARAQVRQAKRSVRSQGQFNSRLDNFRSNLSNRAIKAAAQRQVTGKETGKGGRYNHLQDVQDQLRGLDKLVQQEKNAAAADPENAAAHELNAAAAERLLTERQQYLQRQIQQKQQGSTEE